MKNYNIFLLIIFAALFSCSDNKKAADGKEIMLKSDKTSFTISSASFRFIRVGEDSNDIQEKTFWVKRNPKDSVLGVMLRAEDMNGSVMTYNGSSYLMKDTNNKKVIIPDSLTKPSDMAGIYWNIFNVVLKVYSDSANIAKAGKIEYIGSEILDGHVCDVLYFTKLYEGNVMRSYMSISQSDNILRKLYAEIVKDNKIISKTKFLVEDLKINQQFDDSLFVQKIPESYKIEYFNLK